MTDKDNKLFNRHIRQRILIYIISLFLFSGCIVIMNGIKQTTKTYYETSIQNYEWSLWEAFYSNLKNAQEFGRFSITNCTNEIQNDIRSDLDMEKLRFSLENNVYYKDFDLLLRSTFQDNVFTLRSYSINRNRNSIFVLCNGKIIANYSYDGLYGIVYKDNQVIKGNDIRDIVSSRFYNKKLSLAAIDSIENHSSDLIVWQEVAPNNFTDKTYTSFDWSTIKEIFDTQGIEGFASYEILIPTYITDYGNIFGEYDNNNGTANNKIIIVQKLNIKDYFTVLMPSFDMVSFNRLNEMKNIYSNIQIITNIFEIILYLSIGAYLTFVVFNINRLIDEINDFTDQ